MAASPAIQKIAHHSRSISLPSRSHPLTLRVEEHLCRLRSSELATSSSSSICHNLAGLQDLYDSVDELLQSSVAQNSISSGPGKCVDWILDGSSLEVLDVCGNTRDILSHMKESLQDLQSCVRRRGAESSVANEVSTYILSRKKGNKMIHKCLADMKKMEHDVSIEDNEIVTILSQVEKITIAMFESILSFISGTKAVTRSKRNSWSLVSKLMHTKPQEEKDTTEVVKADVALNILISRKPCKAVDVKNIQELLEALEMSIQAVEVGLNSLFRSLIKTRVSLLNILK
ncbi:hypothetical protein AQUCO_00700858v1 [Aquilegia coerulea]|uniref:DUF241 domain-containing protein n=1 Tax=Aquilegia coerulea TaxID=218851 RepID=A0A2G5EM20_AQUCA|nr:hypothetical protein AQUCO_00700858v1 [Aquilegia coerulea]